MKELTKVFSGIKIPVEVVDDENIWFDVSNINKNKKVKFTEWRDSKRTKETLRLIEKSTSLNRPLIDDEVYGKNFIHKKMFISYARFVSVEFEIKADEIIMDILLGEKHLCDQKYNTAISQLKISQQQTIDAKRSKYACPRLGNRETITRIISDYSIEMSANDLNMLLVGKEILIAKPKKGFDFIGDIMSGSTPLLHVDSVLKIVDNVGITRGRGYSDIHQTLDFNKH